jgi:putative ABC transport system permease protein
MINFNSTTRYYYFKQIAMLKNFFKISWRNLVRHKSYSAINIFGLTIGLAVCMFIMSYVGHEMTFDSFHKEKDRICWIQGTFKGQGDTVYNQMMSFATGPILKLNNPEVEAFLRTGTLLGSIRVKSPVSGAKQIEETKFLFADSNFFNFFTFPLLQGSPSEVLNKPFAVVISKKTAEKYFGTANPVGQMLMVNNDLKLWVSGVAKNVVLILILSHPFQR